MATSIGEAAARGLESGFNIGLRATEQRRREEESAEQRQRQMRLDTEAADERAFNRSRLEQQDARIVEQDARARLKDELTLADQELAGLTDEAKAMAANLPGGWDTADPAWRQDYAAREQQARARRADIATRFYQPRVDEMRKKASEAWARVGAGQLSLDEMPDRDLYENIAVLARRPIEDFMPGKDGSPSKIKQAGMDLEAAMPNPARGFGGNMDLAARAANVLFAPEVQKGIGERGRDGSVIESKEIVSFAPHPQNPEAFVPLVRVVMRRPDGATASYIAPITENRSSDPNDNVKTITLDGALERVGQLTTLAEAISRPDMQKRLEKGAKDGGAASAQEFLQAISRAGVTPKKPGKTTTKDTDLGDRVRTTTYDEAGKEVGTSYERKGAAPKARGLGGDGDGHRKLTNLEKKLQTIEDQQESGLISPEEAQNAKKRALGLGEGASDKPLTEGQAKANLFSKRMLAADAVLEEIGGKYSPMAISAKAGVEDLPLAGGLLGMAANAALGEKEQRVEQAQRDFINAVLRRESGAAIAKSEFSNAARQYFPQPGDSAAVIEQKRQNRTTAIQGLVEELPQNRRPQMPDRRPAAQDAAAPSQERAPNPVRPGIELPRATPPRAAAPAAAQPMIAVNPQTGERLILKGGQWQPLK